MKDVIAAIERGRENGRPLAIENADKTTIAEVTKVLITINLGNKYSWTISNTTIDAARDLK